MTRPLLGGLPDRVRLVREEAGRLTVATTRIERCGSTRCSIRQDPHAQWHRDHSVRWGLVEVGS